MGTRADFYVGRGEGTEWVASIAWDGYPEGIADGVLAATDETSYRSALQLFLEPREDTTWPADGWPWPWEDSNTTDFAYALHDGCVWASCFGHPWQRATEWDDDVEDGDVPVFPNMKDVQKVDYGKRSGVMFISAPVDAGT